MLCLLIMRRALDISNLSNQAGVDFEALRNKYKGIAAEERKKAIQGSTDGKKSEAARQAMKRLDDYKICNTCQGQGFVKELYNHFWQEKDCPDCDGEAVMLKNLQHQIQENIS